MTSDSPRRVRNGPDRRLQGVQHVFLARGLGLFLVDHRARLAAFGSEADHVLVPEPRDRSVEDRGAAGSFADRERDRRGQACVGRLRHHRERLLDAVVRHEAEERRLFELDDQSLAQRDVERRIAGRVREFGEQHRVLVAKRGRRAPPGGVRRHDHGCDHECAGDGHRGETSTSSDGRRHRRIEISGEGWGGSRDGGQEPVAPFGNRFDIDGPLGLVAQCVTQLADRDAQAAVEMDECAFRPDAALELLARHHVACVFEKDDEQPERLVLQAHTSAVLQELA